MQNNQFHSIATTDLTDVTGGFDSAKGLLEHMKQVQNAGNNQFRPAPPPNLAGGLLGDFRTNLGTWIRFGG